MKKATNEQIIAAYKDTGSVWRAAKQLGMAGQTVHGRLVALGYPIAGRHWTDAEVTELKALVEAGLPLGEVARRLGRPFSGVATKASVLGIKVKRKRVVKVPRGIGMDKRAVAKHLDALEQDPATVSQYARKHGLRVEFLCASCEKNFPERWRAYVESRSDLPRKACGYCENVFVPSTQRQSYCNRKCAADARADRNYFGGKRRMAVGLDAGICQICGRQGAKGLSAHHVLGKENDPENDVLVALCPGCHNVVTALGGRAFIETESSWEALIAFVWLRKKGLTLPAGHALNVCVDIDLIPEFA